MNSFNESPDDGAAAHGPAFLTMRSTAASVADAELVSLNPPLPCVGPKLGSGFITAIGPDGFRLRLTSSMDRATSLAEGGAGAIDVLTIAASDDRTFQLTASIVAARPLLAEGMILAHARAVGPDALAVLSNLLTMVRKAQHIDICATTDVEAKDRFTGFSEVLVRARALPELALDDLDTRTTFLGRTFPLPLMITGMTGGVARGTEINLRLAAAAAHFGIPMGVGSQRIALEHPEHAAIFRVKRATPTLFLIGNLGIGQLKASTALDQCRRAVDMIEADALAIHVNVLQEAIQVEGDRDFRGLIDAIAHVARRLSVPLLVKEVGVGIDPISAKRLAEAGVRAIDVGGKGGTSWSFIEGARSSSPVTAAVADTFRDFGIPTAVGLKALSSALPGLDLAATGGIRDGLTVAKAVGLGAKLAGIGLPLFRAALSGDEAPFTVLETFAKGLRTAMIVSGARTLKDLGAVTRPTKRFLELMSDHTE